MTSPRTALARLAAPFALLLLAGSTAASPAPDSPPPIVPTVAADARPPASASCPPCPPTDVPPAPAPPATLEPEQLAWGTVGVQAVGMPQPAWVAGTIRLAVLRPLAGLRLERVRLLDADGNVLAETVSELELRVASAENVPGDFSAYGTEPLEGDLPAGARLRLRLSGRLDRSFDDLCPGLCNPAAGERYQAVLRTAAGDELRVEGLLGGTWPTA